jgi:hypothetical protein
MGVIFGLISHNDNLLFDLDRLEPSDNFPTSHKFFKNRHYH